ncbi:MAG: hypothetical protein ABSG51_07625 [Terracidiphilus sp.]|jgi:hypothetical protein
MNDSEAQALRYLSSLGFAQVVYEPDGNVPPDFLVNGRVAVEVRRLNFNYVDEAGHVEGVENSQFALLRYMRRLLPTFGPPKAGQSWIVRFWFKRPLPPLDKLRRAIQVALSRFRDGQLGDQEISISDQFTLYLFPCTVAFPNRFVLGGYVDRNAGGWVVSELEKNIQICVKEKTGKITRMRAKYPEWWLVLVDHIGFGQKESLNVRHEWDKVILINPLKPEEGYEV